MKLMKISHEICWAKTTPDGRPGISVHDHCLNVGCVAEALIEKLPPRLRALLPKQAALLAALHDIGKASPGFQKKCPAWEASHPLPQAIYEPDHAKISQWFLHNRCGDEFSKMKRWFMAVGAHHGHSKGDWTIRRNIPNINCGGPEWESSRMELLQQILVFFNNERSEIASLLPLLDDHWETRVNFLAGLVVVADWIGSDERFFSPAPENPRMPLEKRREKAASAVKAIGFSIPAIREIAFSDLFPKLTEPNVLQKCLTELAAGPGLYIIEAPMGCGKTEAALFAAAQIMDRENLRGIYFALPTQTTSNRIYERVGDFLTHLLKKEALLRLAHGSSWLQENDDLMIRPAVSPSRTNDGDCGSNAWAARMWFSSARRALLAPFGVGTIDQALLGVVAAKYFYLRLFGLAGKVVILDEVHSYDLYTSTLLDQLIEDLLRLHVTVIVLSATLTRRRRDQLISIARRIFGNSGITAEVPKELDEPILPYPLISVIAERGAVFEKPVNLDRRGDRDIYVRCAEFSFEAQVEECCRRAEAGQVVFWIHNTVDKAQDAYRAVLGTLKSDGAESVLLHSRYPWFRRDALEKKWLERLGKDTGKRPKGAVVVATQVVEQSVDIDADFMLTDLAPTDMLLQRAGRLWRHDHPSRPCQSPELWIHSSEALDSDDPREIVRHLKPSSSVYEPYVLLRSWREWSALQHLKLPGDIRSLLENTYNSFPNEPEAWKDLRLILERKRDRHQGRAEMTTNRWNLEELRDDEGIQTRLNDYPTVQLILLRSLEQPSKGRMSLTPLEGESVIATEREWSGETARALFRNTVRIPAWWLKGRERNHPTALRRALRRYFFGDWAWTIVEGENLWLNGSEGETSGLKYLPDRGVWCEISHDRIVDTKPDYEDDESDY
jgi:CRISPR-associated endonuclease/helicase Cas3